MGKDFEHWPRRSEEHDHLDIYRPWPSRRRSAEYEHYPSRDHTDREMYLYRPHNDREEKEVYEHWPINSKTLATYRAPARRPTEKPARRSRPAENDDEDDREYWAITISPRRSRQRRSPSPRYAIVESSSPPPEEDEEDTKIYSYVPRKDRPKREREYKLRKKSPARKEKDKIWVGRSREQVKEDNARIAEAQEKPRRAIRMKADDYVWVEELDGSYELYRMSDLDDVRGEWKTTPQDPDSVYFVKAPSKK